MYKKKFLELSFLITEASSSSTFLHTGPLSIHQKSRIGDHNEKCVSFTSKKYLNSKMVSFLMSLT